MAIKFTGRIPDGPIAIRYSFSKTLGPTTEYIYEGPQAIMASVFAACQVAADEVDWDQQGAVNRVTARIARLAAEAGEEVPTVEVRMESNQVEVPILEHEDFDGLTDEQYRQIRESLEDRSKPKVTGISEPAASIYNMAWKGQTSFIRYRPVFIVNRVASNYYEFSVSYTNCGLILATSMVADDAGVSSALLKFNLPAGSSPNAGFVYGWMKAYPTFTATSYTRICMSQTYVYGLWPTAIYGDLIS